MSKQFYDFLGNELFDGDEVITIKKNGRAVGGDLVKVKIKIQDNKMSFLRDGNWSRGLYENNLGSKCYKVMK